MAPMDVRPATVPAGSLRLFGRAGKVADASVGTLPSVVVLKFVMINAPNFGN